MTNKVCGTCKETKNRSDFEIVGKSQVLSKNCKPCRSQLAEKRKAYRKAWNDANYNERYAPNYWQTRLERRYGLSRERYDQLLEEQQGTCAICNGVDKNRRLHVDHNHETDEVRGLLCTNCNTRLEVLERKQWLKDAEEYLRRTDVQYG